MVIVGLLLIALVCLIVGLVLPNTAWLVASLIASAGAGYLLWRSRNTLRAAHAGAGGATTTANRTKTSKATKDRDATDESDAADTAESDDAEDTLDTFDTDAEPGVAGDDETAEFASLAEMLPAVEEPAVEEPDAAEPEPAPEPEPIAAVEPEPEPIVAAEPEREPEPEPVRAAEPEPTAQYVADEGDVWVIDGRPRYHLAHCAIIQGQDAEPISLEQATEDGFMPCSLCEPNAVRTG